MARLTMAELMAQEKDAKNNSDLLNLANAKIRIIDTRRALLKYFKELNNELNETEVELDKLAADIEAGEEFDVSDISTVYNKAQRPKTQFGLINR